MIFKKLTLLTLTLSTASYASSPNRSLASNFGSNIVNRNVTEAEVEAAQKAWGNALIQISKDFEAKGIRAATKTANNVLDAAYGYNLGTVLFKPTLTEGDHTFRTTREGALSYFVGGNKKFPKDMGFALMGWTDFSFNNAGVYIDGDKAITMGKVTLKNSKGETVLVDKTWGFKKDQYGKLRIVLHHSSLPYKPS